MKNKGKIVSVKIGVDGNMDDYLDGFRVKVDGVGTISIDPFVDDNFADVLDEMPQDEQIDWAREQVGKVLFYDELVPCDFITHGKVYIV